MNNELYFIEKLSVALESHDLRCSLHAAFADIRKSSHNPQFARGYQQFLLFMEEVERSCLKESLPEAASYLDCFLRPSAATLSLVKGELKIAEREWTGCEKSWWIQNVTPGAYCLKLETGLIIWEGDLTSSFLLWDEAFPGRGFEMAAATEPSGPTPSQSITIAEYGLCMKVLPGIESGALHIEHAMTEDKHCE